jgi:hypothetical protein
MIRLVFLLCQELDIQYELFRHLVTENEKDKPLGLSQGMNGPTDTLDKNICS